MSPGPIVHTKTIKKGNRGEISFPLPKIRWQIWHLPESEENGRAEKCSWATVINYNAICHSTHIYIQWKWPDLIVIISDDEDVWGESAEPSENKWNYNKEKRKIYGSGIMAFGESCHKICDVCRLSAIACVCDKCWGRRTLIHYCLGVCDSISVGLAPSSEVQIGPLEILEMPPFSTFTHWF